MINDTTFEKLAIKQLDLQLDRFKPLRNHMPTGGWIYHIRKILKLPVSKLGKLMGISHAAVLQMEKREAEGHITLESLEKAAQCMGCTVVYALVPQDSLMSYIDKLKHLRMTKLIQETGLTMSLEAQSLSSKDLKAQQELLEQNLQAVSLSELWKNL